MSNSRNKQIEEYAHIFKALSNPNRLKIFLRLSSMCGTPASADEQVCKPDMKGCSCVGDIGKFLDIAPSTISHHLKELRQAGLITMARRGQKMECEIDPKMATTVGAFFSLDE